MLLYVENHKLHLLTILFSFILYILKRGCHSF